MAGETLVNKFRSGKIKREHSIVSSIEPLLERLEQCPAVQAIIPAEIAHSPSPAQPTLTFQRCTEQGLRLLGKGGGAVQEVYVVTPDREAVLEWMRQEGWLPQPGPEPKAAGKPGTGAGRAGVDIKLEADEVCAACGHIMRAGTVVRAIGQGRRQQRMHRWCARKV